MRSNGSSGSNGQGEETDDDVEERDGNDEDADAKPAAALAPDDPRVARCHRRRHRHRTLVEAFLVQAFWIPSPSMEPTLEVGDRVLVNKLSYKFHDVNRGDVVVFERPPGASTGQNDEIKDLIKRVIAVGGDTIESQGRRGLRQRRAHRRALPRAGHADRQPAAPDDPRGPCVRDGRQPHQQRGQPRSSARSTRTPSSAAPSSRCCRSPTSGLAADSTVPASRRSSTSASG